MNERMQQLWWHVRRAKRLFGRRSLRWMGVGIFGAFLLIGVEFSIAIFLQLFVVSLGVSRAPTLPGWMPSFLIDATFVWLLVGLALIGVVRFCAYTMAEMSTGIVQELIQARLRLLTLYELLFVQREEPTSSAEVHHRFGEIIPNVGQFAYFSVYSLVYAFLCGLLFLMMCVLFPKEALFGSGGLLGIGLLTFWLNRKARGHAKAMPGLFKLMEQGIVRVARNLFLVRVLQTQHREHAVFTGAISDYFRASLRSLWLISLASNSAPLLGLFLLVALVYLSQRVFLTPGVQLMAFLYLFVRFIQQVKLSAFFYGEANRRWARYLEAVTFVDALPEEAMKRALSSYQELSWLGETREPIIEESSQERPTRRPPSLSLKGVSFRYTGATKTVFDQLDLTIQPGEHFGIVGRSGAGKSTLLGLILGVLEPTEGTIAIDGLAPGAYLAGENTIGYVGPEPFLLAGSVRDNLRYGATWEIDEQELWEALEQVQLHDVVRSMPAQLDALVSERGEGFSAGEKQRLALARALLRRPSLLILDEASANLDTKTEQEIAALLRERNEDCTTLIVSHREGLLQHVARTLTLGPGGHVSIVEGPPRGLFDDTDDT